MTTEVRVPTLGESVTEATIATWFKQPGEQVAADEMLCELETDKVTVEVPSPAAGKLVEHVAAEGETVEVNALIATIEEGASGAAPEKTEPKPGAAEKEKATKGAQAGYGDRGGEPAPTEPKPETSAREKYTADKPARTDIEDAPSAKKAMAEAGLSRDEVKGTGRDGRVMKEDVLRAVAEMGKRGEAEAPSAPRAPVAVEDAQREKRVKMTRLRQTIARRLKDAQNTAAMLTTYNEVDMSGVMGLRNEYKELFEKKHKTKLGFMGFFVKACTHALKEIAAVNAEIDGTDIVYKNYCHIGVAVGTPQGLVVPVIRDADQMSFAQIEKTISDFGLRARDGKLKMDEMQGGTFTISNGGVYGSLMSSPILNPPQSGILGMHKIQERPMVIGGQIVARPMMYLALSYDHRIVDGKEAVTFLVRVKESLEDPRRLLMDL